MNSAASRPLHALISQLLVAYTIEADNEFELKMAQDGDPGARLSLVVWFNLLRFLADSPVSVSDLSRLAIIPIERLRGQLGCLERWRFIQLSWPCMQARSTRREGWGSGRGIRLDWTVQLTSRGHQAAAAWPRVLDEVEQRWHKRYQVTLDQVQPILKTIATSAEQILPLFLGSVVLAGSPVEIDARAVEVDMTLPSLLARVLMLFTLEFARTSKTPLAICANAVRAIGSSIVPERELPHLTGCSPETVKIGWQLKHYINATADVPRGRGKVLRLTPLGLGTARDYTCQVVAIEGRWAIRYGKRNILRIRQGLEAMFVRSDSGVAPLMAALIPPPGTARAGELAPSLGRRSIAAAARQRVRDLAAQTQAFLRDPDTLPHYPLWDMNRGYGP